MKSSKKLRAIDLYSGVGGWSLGLKMAGIEVVNSYEWWDKANETNKLNNHHTTTEQNIRLLNPKSLPEGIDIVVGSPPCTQFSFSNRGGSGDIDDGLIDIEKFLEIVLFLKPKHWAMENVPRVSSIIERELKPGGRLSRYACLKPVITVVDAHHWGVPQKRQRCIVGNINFDLLNSYKKVIKIKTLGDVVNALGRDTIIDPNYLVKMSGKALVDHDIEEFLSAEEVRINRDAKAFHPVYNNMEFPDSLNRPARTVTATCTRISRESIVISAPENPKKFRRLTVRERACLQGFPVFYQFFGDTYSQKIKMVGNAVPPLLSFYIAQAMLDINPERVIAPSVGIRSASRPLGLPPVTVPDTHGERHAHNRRFRAAIPNLRFKSGMRFELSNGFNDRDEVSWRVRFFLGDSKNIAEIELGDSTLKEISASGVDDLLRAAKKLSLVFVKAHKSLTARQLQESWSKVGKSKISPFDLVDEIGELVDSLLGAAPDDVSLSESILARLLARNNIKVSSKKAAKYAGTILVGLILACFINQHLRAKEFNS
jgi:DNA (cytosine-5)-methyltransferase 1